MDSSSQPLDSLHAFRDSFYRYLNHRANALFELTDALLTRGPVPSPPHLSLQAVHRRGWGSLYAALSKGRIDEGSLRDLRHPLKDGGPDDPPVYAGDVSVWPRCDAEASPGRGYYYHPSRHSAGQPIVAGWAYQLVAQLGFERDSWVAPVDARRVKPVEDTDEVATEQVRVIIQSPEPGTKAERGASISVVVSAGRETVQLPDVVGKARDEAERDLSAAGFKVEVKTEESSEEGAGKVLDQSPPAGEVKKGSEVALTIGEGAEPAPGYNMIQDPAGGLTVEIPPSWGVDTGEDSEYPSGVSSKSWSKFAGEEIPYSITTAPSLDAWYSEPATGAYIVASWTLAQNYSDDELIYSGLFADMANNCEAGPSEAFHRSSLSGKMQTWYNCRGLGITNFVVAAHPEGRTCVVVLQARVVNEADQEAVQHVLDTFDVDCSRVS